MFRQGQIVCLVDNPRNRAIFIRYATEYERLYMDEDCYVYLLEYSRDTTARTARIWHDSGRHMLTEITR